ncbi:hypothetical protein JQC92_08225 [Shewanella sp. 202IG2-18]|uniref:ankyrin repeat domain-containing protein n=1 Tax=Parashewanella hymeniacidonis TaxID=2807618 RepID=UPI00195F69C5|nr:ankyrin repeat domain-containing protein [Parashewanella hymeniacidonis]MBM7072014.1 hypothetical protein [Parashewanella hymeniacidonis]
MNSDTPLMSLSTLFGHQLNDASSKEHFYANQAENGRKTQLQEMDFLRSREAHTVSETKAETMSQFLESDNREGAKTLTDHQFTSKEHGEKIGQSDNNSLAQEVERAQQQKSSSEEQIRSMESENGIDESSCDEQTTESHYKGGNSPEQPKPLTSSPRASLTHSSSSIQEDTTDEQENLSKEEIDQRCIASYEVIPLGSPKIGKSEIKEGAHRDLANLIQKLPKAIKKVHVTKIKILRETIKKVDIEKVDSQKLAAFEANFKKILMHLSDESISNDIKRLAISQWCTGEPFPAGNLALLTLSCARKGYSGHLRQVRERIFHQMKQHLIGHRLTATESAWAEYRLAQLCGLSAEQPKQRLEQNENKKVLAIIQNLEENQSVWFSCGRQVSLLVRQLNQAISETVGLNGEIALIRDLGVFTDTRFSTENYQNYYCVGASNTGQGLKQQLCQLLGVWYVISSSDNEVSELTCGAVINTVITDERERRDIYLQAITKTKSIQELNTLLDGLSFDDQNAIIRADVKQRVIEQLTKLQEQQPWAYSEDELQQLSYEQLKQEIQNEVALQGIERSDETDIKSLAKTLKDNVYSGCDAFKQRRLERCCAVFSLLYKKDTSISESIYLKDGLLDSSYQHEWFALALSWLKTEYIKCTQSDICNTGSVTTLTQIINIRCLKYQLPEVCQQCLSEIEQKLTQFLNDGSLTPESLCNALPVGPEHVLYPTLEQLLFKTVNRDLQNIDKSESDSAVKRSTRFLQLLSRINKLNISEKTRDRNHREVTNKIITECRWYGDAQQFCKSQMRTDPELLIFLLQSFYFTWGREAVGDNQPFIDDKSLECARQLYKVKPVETETQRVRVPLRLNETESDFYLMQLISEVNINFWKECSPSLRDGALIVAAKIKNIEFFNLLLLNKANPNFVSPDGQKAIAHCVVNGFLAGYEKLLPYTNLSCNVDERRQENIAHKAAKSLSFNVFMKVLGDYDTRLQHPIFGETKSKKELLESKNFVSLSVLDLALLNEFESAITYMIKKEVDIETRQRFDRFVSGSDYPELRYHYLDLNPFEFAIKHFKSKAVGAIAKGNSELLEVKGVDGNTPLLYAAMHGDSDCVNALRHCGAKVGASNSSGQGLLHCAAYNSDEATFHLIWNLSELSGETFAKDIANPLEIALTNAETPASTCQTIIRSGAISLSESGHLEINAFQYAAAFATSLEKLDIVLKCFLTLGSINAYGTGSQNFNTALDQVRDNLGLKQVFLNKLRSNGALTGNEIRVKQKTKSDADEKQRQLIVTLKKDIRTLAWEYSKLREQAEDKLSWLSFHEYPKSVVAKKYKT